MTGAAARSDVAMSNIEERTRTIGRELFERIGRGSSPLERAWWDDQLMNLTLSDPDVRVQLFRFIDVLPVLRDDAAVRRHLGEYLDEAGDRVPWWLRLPLWLAPEGSVGARILGGVARLGALHMARRFIAGESPDEALETVRSLRREGLAFTADLLGEAVISEPEAEVYQRTCINLVKGLTRPLAAEPFNPRIDRDDQGPIPRVNLSLKLTSLTARFDALHPETTADRVAARLRPILRLARSLGAHVHVDMEQYSHKDLTFSLFRSVMMEDEFRDWRDVGIVAQTYLPDTEHDLAELASWARERGTSVAIRLVKGAYWDYEVLLARQLGWPVPFINGSGSRLRRV
ncbi:MAG: proline dehydrogenase family protein [Isosphaeraceae bacterium]